MTTIACRESFSSCVLGDGPDPFPNAVNPVNLRIQVGCTLRPLDTVLVELPPGSSCLTGKDRVAQAVARTPATNAILTLFNGEEQWNCQRELSC